MKSKKLLKKIYFIKYGQRTGQFLIFIDFDKEKNIYSLLALPESEPLYVSQNDIERAINFKAIEFVEDMPDNIYNECKSEFKYRENNK
jgi:hypothetical protein